MGLRYRKGQGLKENMVLADEIMEKKRGLSWTDSAGLASFLLQMSTSDLSDLDNLKRQKDELDRLFNRNNNYPYSEEYLEKKKDEVSKMLREAWDEFLAQMRTINLGNDSGMMNEGLRAIRQNSQKYKSISKTRY